ncbi:unnamed protein product [Rotaria sp. Silwood2]|nr:unnamed protein product [Rotaria sp. Silwood2]CAF3282122.1 unnamed protein product [Rotaria sp. Silwood2]CAF4325378.1 unnamed protein product [Rotaria sp. Silwood2]CAF4516829.1 unnamed protein product [Rotaria sp. Silwood2]
MCVDKFCIIWLDANANTEEIQNAEQKLASIINHFEEFQDKEQCQKYIETRSEKDRLVIIVSGRFGKEIVPSVHYLPQVMSIYVYCMDKKLNEQWACKFAKVKAVVVQFDELISRIETDHQVHKTVKESFSINSFTTSVDAGNSTIGVNGLFLFSEGRVDFLKVEALKCITLALTVEL